MTKSKKLMFPFAVFVGVWALHYSWLIFFPEQDPAQSLWAPVENEQSWFQRYVESQSYFLSFSYSLSFAFAMYALRKYREDRYCSSKRIVIGGFSFSGILAVAGCYLIGCCGSPMLAVYLSFFGAWFLPFAKPLIALITIAFIAGAWLWMRRREKQEYDSQHCNKISQVITG